MGFLGGPDCKESTCNAEDLGSIPGLGRSPGEVIWPGVFQDSRPVFWPGEFHGLYTPWGCKGSDTTEHISLHFPPVRNQARSEIYCGYGVLGASQSSNSSPDNLRLKCLAWGLVLTVCPALSVSLSSVLHVREVGVVWSVFQQCSAVTCYSMLTTLL